MPRDPNCLEVQDAVHHTLGCIRQMPPECSQIWEKYDPAAEAAAAGENGEETNGAGGGETQEVVVTEV